MPYTNKARLRLSFGGVIGRPLIRKLVKPIKVARFCLADEVHRYQVVVVKAQPQMWAAHAALLRKPDTAVWIEVPCLDLVYRRLHQSAKFLTLVLGGSLPSKTSNTGLRV